MSKTAKELERELEKAREREEWERQNPEGIKEAYDRGHSEGWSKGFHEGVVWAGEMTIRMGDVYRTKHPEPAQVSLERIAAMLEELRGEARP